MTIVTVVSDTALDGRDRLVVAPAHGRLEIGEPGRTTSEGEFVRAKDVLARVASDTETIDVVAPCDAWVISFLLRDGERVEPGAAIVHLRAL